MPPLWRANAPALVVAAALTAVVELGTCWLAGWHTGSAVGAGVLASLFWTVLAAPAFAAGGRAILDSLLRAAAVAGGNLVLLVVLAGRGDLDWPAAGQLFLLYAALAGAGAGVVILFRTLRGRCLAALAFAAVIVVLSSGPFWANGLLAKAKGPQKDRLAGYVMLVNPVSAALGEIPARQGALWTTAPIFYNYSAIGHDVPMPRLSWAATFSVYAVLAIVLSAIPPVFRRTALRPGRGG